MIRHIQKYVALLTNHNHEQQDIGEWIMSLCQAIYMQLEDNRKQQFKTILQVIQVPITYRNGSNMNSLKIILNNFYQELAKECPDKPEKVANMPAVLIITYDRFRRNTQKKLKHEIEFLEPEISSGNKSVYRINDTTYILTGVIVHKGDSKKRLLQIPYLEL